MMNNDKTNNDKTNNDKKINKDKLYNLNSTKFTKHAAKNIKKLNQHRIKKIVKNLNNSDDYLHGETITLQKIKIFLSYFHRNIKLKIKSIFDDFVFE